jgi:hypothetical protein
LLAARHTGAAAVLGFDGDVADLRNGDERLVQRRPCPVPAQARTRGRLQSCGAAAWVQLGVADLVAYNHNVQYEPYFKIVNAQLGILCS